MSKLDEAKEIMSSLKVPAKQQNGMASGNKSENLNSVRIPTVFGFCPSPLIRYRLSPY